MNRPFIGSETVLARKIAGSKAKRVLDIAGSVVALALLAPVLIASIVAIKLTSRGPAFYRQPRRGLNGRVFNICKLRTLHHERCDEPAVQSIRAVEDGDSRVFPVGWFLRKRGLDEIPQFWNVLKGEMSIVGPRPHALAHDDLFLMNVPGYVSRYVVKPGITGWAQINGSRGSVSDRRDVEQRVMLDCEYIERWTLFLDFVIAVRTGAIILFASGPGTRQRPTGPPSVGLKRGPPVRARLSNRRRWVE